MTKTKVGDFGVKSKVGFWGRFHHYVFIMHIHRSVIGFLTRRIILPSFILIHISFRSSRLEINVLPNNRYINQRDH